MIATVRIVNPEGGFYTINQSDFRAGEHTLFVADQAKPETGAGSGNTGPATRKGKKNAKTSKDTVSGDNGGDQSQAVSQDAPVDSGSSDLFGTGDRGDLFH